MSLRLYFKRNPPLGDLEREVMEWFWVVGQGSALDLHADFAQRRDIALSTVQSTLERLARKDLLERKKCGRAYNYLPAVSRQTLLARMVAELVSDLAADDAPASVGVMDLSRDVDDATLDRLAEWVSEARLARNGGGRPR